MLWSTLLCLCQVVYSVVTVSVCGRLLLVVVVCFDCFKLFQVHSSCLASSSCLKLFCVVSLVSSVVLDGLGCSRC